jgi:hypothetical protein
MNAPPAVTNPRYCAAAEDQQAAQDLSAKQIASKKVLDESEGSEFRSWMHHFKDLDDHPERYQRVLPPSTIATNSSWFKDLSWVKASKQWGAAVSPRGEGHIFIDNFAEKGQALGACSTAAVEAQGTMQNLDLSSSIGRLKHHSCRHIPSFLAVYMDRCCTNGLLMVAVHLYFNERLTD